MRTRTGAELEGLSLGKISGRSTGVVELGTLVGNCAVSRRKVSKLLLMAPYFCNSLVQTLAISL